MARLHGILLDFYGTIVHEDDFNIVEITARIVANSPLAVSTEEVGKFWHASFFRLIERSFGDAFITQRVIGMESLRETFDAFNVSLRPEDEIAQQFAHWMQPPIFPDAAGFLTHIHERGLPVCIVSNIDRSDLIAAIGFHGLEFDHLVTSEDARAYKPRSEMFHIALELMGLGTADVLHTGDSWNSDVRGAAALGIPVAWLNRTGKETNGDPGAVYVVCDLQEVRSIVDAMI